jgi:hypothetical protein
MGKETLEEAAINNYKELYEGEPLTQDVPIDAFKQGAKWQMERSCSEEEVLEHLNYLNTMPSSKLDLYIDDDEMITAKWFEQFKNK